MARARAQEEATPMRMPTAAESERLKKDTGLKFFGAEAPRAMRIPISCVRWLTEYEMTA